MDRHCFSIWRNLFFGGGQVNMAEQKVLNRRTVLKGGLERTSSLHQCFPFPFIEQSRSIVLDEEPDPLEPSNEAPVVGNDIEYE